MTESLVLEAHGRTVELVGPVTALESARMLLPSNYVQRSLAPERSWRLSETENGWRVSEAGNEIASGQPAADAVHTALSSLELWVAEHAREVIFLHAGCIEMDGRAMVLPGFTLSGKTTLTAALVRAGARYLSDEYAILNREGAVLPYARPLSMRHEDGTVTRVRAEEIGARASEAPVAIGVFAMLRFDTAGWRVERLSRAAAIVALLTQTVPAQSRTLEATTFLGRATRSAVTLRGTRGDADGTAETLLAMLRDGSAG